MLRPAPAGPGEDAEPPVYPLPVKDIAAEKRRLQTVMALSGDDLERWNPALADFCHVGCPSCGEGKACGSGVLEWREERPFEIRCLHCGEVFPSARFPHTGETCVTAPDGTVQRYAYREGPGGWPYYVEALILNKRRAWLRSMAQRLGGLYRATGEERYASQAKAILLSFARAYDRLPVHGSVGMDFRPAFFPLRTGPVAGAGRGLLRSVFPDQVRSDPFPKWSVRQGSHWYYREIPGELVLAYDQIKPVLNPSEREEVERLIRATVQFARSFRPSADNMAASLACREIMAGRVLDEPEIVQGAVDRLELLMSSRFYADGAWYEMAPSYFSQVCLSLEECWRALAENHRPAGDTGGVAGWESALRTTEGDLARVRGALDRLRRPDGELATIYDTWSTPGTGSRKRARGEVPSSLLWASGHAVLTHLAEGQPLQARLHFSAKNGSHYHLDNLNLQLYALGREPYSDFGYTRTPLRPYARTTVAHNTVVVDDEPQELGRRSSMGGQVEVFEDGAVSLVSVASPGSYAQTKLYRRSLALVPAGGSAYVLDWFEVAGGRTHEWFLHGDAGCKERLVLEGEEALLPLPGQVLSDGKPFQPWENAYGNQNDQLDHRVSRRLLRQEARFRLEEGRAVAVFAPQGSAGGCMRTTLISEPGTELIVGAMPSLRQAGEIHAAMRDFETPLLVLRRQARWGGLESRFLALHQPLSGGTRPLRVSGDSTLVRVEGEGFTDLHLLGDQHDARVRFRGRYGMVRFGADGEVRKASLIDGTELTAGGQSLCLPEAVSGKVLRVRGSELELDRAVTLAQAARMYLRLPDGEVYALPLAPGTADAARLVRLGEAPGIQFQGERGEFLAYPRKEIRGSITFVVRYALHFEREGSAPGPAPAGPAMAWHTGARE